MLTSLLALVSLASADCPIVYLAGTPAADAQRTLALVVDGKLYRCPVPATEVNGGQPAPWKLEGVRPERVLRVEVLKPARAQELFGDWASDGAVFFVTRDQVQP